MKKSYSKDDLKIHWNSSICEHSGECVRNLSSVFNPKKKPWIDVNGSSTEQIMRTIDKCPSGALTYDKVQDNRIDELAEPEVSVTIVHNGAARIKGRVKFINRDGTEEIREGQFSICRCGKSSKSPFCDGTHKNLLPKLDE